MHDFDSGSSELIFGNHFSITIDSAKICSDLMSSQSTSILICHGICIIKNPKWNGPSLLYCITDLSSYIVGFCTRLLSPWLMHSKYCSLALIHDIISSLSVVTSYHLIQVILIWIIGPHLYMINSLWPSDTICWHISGSTLSQIMNCCLMTSCHYLNQCWLVNKGFLWHSSESNFARSGLIEKG